MDFQLKVCLMSGADFVCECLKGVDEDALVLCPDIGESEGGGFGTEAAIRVELDAGAGEERGTRVGCWYGTMGHFAFYFVVVDGEEDSKG